MNNIGTVFVVSIYYIATLNFGYCSESQTFCEHQIRKDIPIVYLTLNPISTVSWLGKINQRQLILNWKWPSAGKSNNKTNITFSGSSGDWVGLFEIKAPNGINIDGLLAYLKCCQLLLSYTIRVPIVTFKQI